MVINATFNNISVISWRTVLLVEETGVPGENHRRVTSNWQALSHNVVSSTLSNGIRTIVVIDTDCTVSYKSNYNTITTTMAPGKLFVLYNTIFHLHRHIFPCSTTFMKLSAG